MIPLLLVLSPPCSFAIPFRLSLYPEGSRELGGVRVHLPRDALRPLPGEVQPRARPRDTQWCFSRKQRRWGHPGGTQQCSAGQQQGWGLPGRTQAHDIVLCRKATQKGTAWRGRHTAVLCRAATPMGTSRGNMGTQSSALLGSNMDGDILGTHTVMLCQEAGGTGPSWGHRGTPQTSKWHQEPKYQQETMLLPRVRKHRRCKRVIIALQGRYPGGQAGAPASDLGFKGLSLGTVIPQYSPCHGPPHHLGTWGAPEG